ncbi:uncharacterized protein A4U43_C02F14010 [Asparagus officinalis]|uniref:Uncharacterized protein n=1 Tax=Asparagus officinalis TaxID=4686 RepID=A0A5P1FK25_ASPOF|nr:uncharacterized protein A4U43_C02F14010 [Asparagus officinalis]
MERKDNGAKQLGFCHRLFQFVMKKFAFNTRNQVTLGRNPLAKTDQEEIKPSVRENSVVNGVAEKDCDVDEVPLVPPIITIPVVIQEATEKANVDNKRERKKRKQVQVKSGTKEEGENVPKMHEKVGDKGLKKTMSLDGQPWKATNEGKVSDVRPVTPVVRSVSNIDKRFETYIRERKESFGL